MRLHSTAACMLPMCRGPVLLQHLQLPPLQLSKRSCRLGLTDSRQNSQPLLLAQAPSVTAMHAQTAAAAAGDGV
jgi:hypothetical protein